MILSETIGAASKTLVRQQQRFSDARTRLDEARSALIEQVEQNPVRVLSLAAGVGFVLGGGLFSRLAFRIVSASLRLAVVPFLLERGTQLVAEGDEEDDTRVIPPSSRTKEKRK